MDLRTAFQGDFVLESERLLFRLLVAEDAEDMYEYSREERLTRYLLWDPHPSRAYTVRYLEHVKNAYRDQRFFDFALVEKASGKMIGTCGLTTVDCENQACEIGYVLAPKYWGRGLGSEAVRTILSFAFLTLSFHRAEARFMEDNLASRRVAEKNGMRVEGFYRDRLFVKGAYQTVGIAAILCEEFLQLFPSAVSPCRKKRPGDYPNARKRGFFASLFDHFI